MSQNTYVLRVTVVTEFELRHLSPRIMATKSKVRDSWRLQYIWEGKRKLCVKFLAEVLKDKDHLKDLSKMGKKSSGVPSPLCILELSRQINTECQSKHNYIYVVYKVLVYVQTSQPTTCFGLFQLGHLQVGHKGQRNYTIVQYYH